MFGFGAYETHQSILRSSAQNEVEISWAAHLGGAVTGLTLGLVVLRNEDKKWWESVLTAIFGIIFIIYLGKGHTHANFSVMVFIKIELLFKLLPF